jgi:hypothetical protein
VGQSPRAPARSHILVGDSRAVGTAPAEPIAVEVRQVVVVALDALDHIPPAGPAAAPGALDRLDSPLPPSNLELAPIGE